MYQRLTLNITVAPSTPSSLLQNIHFLRSDHRPPHIALGINRATSSSGDVRSDNLACLHTPSSDNGEPLSASVMSHMQKQEQLMSFCITSSPLRSDTLFVHVCVQSSARPEALPAVQARTWRLTSFGHMEVT